MLEYAKVILPKVSFSRQLFRKELEKCINWVEAPDLGIMKEWCYETFGDMYPEILDQAFSELAA